MTDRNFVVGQDVVVIFPTSIWNGKRGTLVEVLGRQDHLPYRVQFPERDRPVPFTHRELRPVTSDDAPKQGT